MSTTVEFFNPDGSPLTDRQFQPGQAIVIKGHVTGILGLGEPFQQVTLTISGAGVSIYDEDSTNIAGNYAFRVTLPLWTGEALVKVVASFSVSGQDIRLIPIGIGAPPTEEVPNPEEQGPGIQEIQKTLETTVKWVAIGLGVVAVAYVASKAAPSIATGVSAVRRA